MAADSNRLGTGGGVALVTRAPAREDYRLRSRRTWSAEDKRAIVAEAEAGAEPVAAVARRHRMNANHLHQWLSRAREGRICGRRGRPPRTPKTAGEIGFITLGMVGDDGPGPSRGGHRQLHGDRSGERRQGAGVGGRGRRGSAPGAGCGEGGPMIALAPGTKVYLACQPVSLRMGFDGLAAAVSKVIQADP